MLLKSLGPRTLSARLPRISAVAMMLVVGACSDPMAPFSPSMLAPPQAPGPQRNAADSTERSPLAAAHKANPADAGAALAYAKALRASGATHAIVHESAYREAEGEATSAVLRGEGAVEIFRQGTDVLLRLSR